MEANEGDLLVWEVMAVAGGEIPHLSFLHADVRCCCC